MHFGKVDNCNGIKTCLALSSGDQQTDTCTIYILVRQLYVCQLNSWMHSLFICSSLGKLDSVLEPAANKQIMYYAILVSHTPSCRGFSLQWQCTNTYSELRGCLLVVWRTTGELISADVVYDSVWYWGDWVIVGWCLTHSFRKRRGRKLAPKILQGDSFCCLITPESSELLSTRKPEKKV